jgi:phosphoglycolate phosphatase
MRGNVYMSLNGLTIAFDLDGTLVDTAPDLIGALNVVLGERSLAPLPVSAARSLVGRGAAVLIQKGFAAAGESLTPELSRELLARFLLVYENRIAEDSRAFDGVEAALRDLQGQGATLCVCTNKPEALAVKLLQELGLAKWFAAVIGGDSAEKPKPDPAPLLLAIQRSGGRPDRALLVGDSETDVATARAAKIPVALVPFGYTEVSADTLGADRVVPDFARLPSAVAELSAVLNPAGA